MRHISMDRFTTRGAAAAMLLLSAAFSLSAQGGGVGGRVVDTVSRRRPRDSTVVRTIDGVTLARLDSIKMISRALEDESPSSPQGIKLRSVLEGLVRSVSEMQRVRIDMNR